MGALRVDLVVPGDPATPTGGYIYDRRILEGLETLGWRIEVHALDSSFPTPTPAALVHARSTFAGIPVGRAVVIDGLALGGLAPLLAAESHRLRLTGLVHHPLADETGLDVAASDALRRAEQESLALVERIVVTSSWTARTLTESGIARERIRIVEPGTDRAPRPSRLRRGTLRLLCVATLTPRKGHALLIDALALLRDLPWHLECVGSVNRDPATAAAVRRQIRELDLEERVTLRGELPAAELADCYRQADVFVLASYLEGYGMALADAVAHGLPILSTTAGAIPDTVPPEASVLVPPGDRDALSAALAALIEDADLVHRLGEHARLASDALPTWPQAAAKFAAAIADLVGAPPDGGTGASTRGEAISSSGGGARK